MGASGRRTGAPGVGIGVSRQTKRAVCGLRNRAASATGGLLSPGGGGGVTTSHASPERSAGVTRLLVEEADSLRRQVAEMRERNERLASQMEGVMSARGAKAGGTSAVETAFYREQLEDRESKARELEKQMYEARDRAAKEKNELQERLSKLEKDKVGLESDLRHALALGDSTENASLQRKLLETDEMNRQLAQKVHALTKNAFIASADTRVASAKGLEQLEADIEGNSKKLEAALGERQALADRADNAEKSKLETEKRCQGLLEQTERLK